MPFSSITIEFTEVPTVGQQIYFVETNVGINFLETFKAIRMAANQAKIPPGSSGSYVGWVSQNYAEALELDLNAIGTFSITATNGGSGTGIGTVVIVAYNPSAVFELDLNTTTAMITIDNQSKPKFDIDTIDFEPATTNQCANAQVSIETSELAVEILQPFAIYPNTDNPITFDWPRGQTFTFRAKDADDQMITQSITTPPLLSAANFDLVINNSPNGSTVIVNPNEFNDGLTFEYSLDGSTWQVSNVFSGLAVDNFTLYIRDQLGCGTTKTFAVTDNAIYAPFFYISKANSIRYAHRVDFNSNQKNDENTLSCESVADIVYKEIQKQCSSDIIQTQFKSNYASNVANVIKADGTLVPLTVVKKTSNIGNTDLRDAKQFNFGNGKTGIYFTSGNIYDYSTNAVIEPFALNGYLPIWGVSGNYIKIGSAWFLIEDTAFDESRNAEVLVLNSVYTGSEISVIAGSIFNIEDYEVYEFDLDMLAYLGQDIRVRIEATDPHFPAITYLSEQQSVAVSWQKNLNIIYWNNTNTDVVYSTGIRFQLRQEMVNIGGISPQDQESQKTDTNVRLLSGDVYEADEIEFEPVTKEMMRKIIIALSHENVYINGVGYVKNDSVDSEQLEHTNLYSLKAKMIKNGNVYNSQTSGSTSVFSGQNTNIPGLVNFNDGFVKY